MRTPWILALVAALLVAALLWVRLGRPSAPREVVTAAPSGEESEPPGLESASVLEPVTQVEERSAVQLAPQVPKVLPDPRLSEIRGRFVLPGGAPAAGVPFEVDGWEKSDEDVRKYGRPEHWEDLNGETDADGRLAVRFEPPRAYQFTLEAKTPGYAGAEWRWGEILAGEVVDLGEVELVRGGAIEGRIVDAEGKVVLGGDWYVYADSVGLDEGEGRDETSARAWADPATGRFRVEDVMLGRVVLRAYDQDWTEETIVQVRSGETTEADIVTQSREKAHGVVLEANSSLFHALTPDPEHVRLTCPDGTIRSPKAQRFSSGWFVFEDLEPGEYILRVDDPRFRPWRCNVRPGAEVEAELEGTSAFAVHVRDGSGAAIDSYSIGVALRNVTFSPHEFETLEEGTYLTRGLVTGLTPGDYRVTVRAGELLGVLDVDGLSTDETRPLDIVVKPPSVVSGHVRYSDGELAKEVEVALLPETPTDPGIAGFPGMSVSERAFFEQDIAKQTTDESGAFHFPILRPGEYLVHASTSRGFEAVSEVLHLTQDLAGQLELVLPRGGFVSGRVLAPSGATCSGLRLWIGALESMRARSSVSETACELAADGRFEIGPIPPGSASAHLLLPIQRQRTGTSGWSWSSGMTNDVVLATLEVADGARVERDFEVKNFPGTVALSVLVNGEIVAGVQVQLSMASEEDELSVSEQEVTVSIEDDRNVSYSNEVGSKTFEVRGETDARGEFGPALAFPGSWTVSLSDLDLGWRFTPSSPVLVSSAAESRSRIQVQLSEATLTFVDAATATPLARGVILLLGPEGPDPTSDWPWRRQRTDAQGRASWTLASGEYRFRLGGEGDELPFLPAEEGAAERPRTATVTWTLEGPLTREVRL